jgi:AbrB family looped-hinge helix DNA binding protein
MSPKAKITSKGQVTIPKAVRDKLDLRPGSAVVFELKESAAVIYPEVERPLDRLREIKQEYSISEKEIAAMIRESKADWDSLD